MKQIYLDYAAATPVDPEVFEVMLPYFSEKFYNPSAVYLAAHDVSRDLSAARSAVAQCIGARPVEVTFTAGGTEANNLAIFGVLAAFPGSKIVTSSIEHDSVLEAARQHDCTEAPVNERGIVDVARLEQVIDDETVLISVMYANNEIGTIQPIRNITALVSRIRSERKARGIALPLYVHTDAAQAGNYLDIHVSRLGVDLMTLNGGKIYGPKASGVLYVRSGVVVRPLVYGGGQEHGLRSGTENVAGAIGFARALELAQEKRGDETRRLQDLQQYFISELKTKISEVVINGSLKKRLPNNVHVTIPGADNERLLFALDERGILAAAGSACSASSDEASHVLYALGLSDERARSSLR
ncbi:MAG: cysteine desulfurase, partial [Candidatus Saccharibacteria bacterium]|nr:cysteine desulfurase [Candidatus Saccharibacteria bacterium]